MKTGPYVARCPEDLIALVPFVLGFHPSESVVLLTFGAPDGSFHARVDLPDGPDDRAQVCDILCNAVRRNRAPTTAVIVFSDEEQRSAAICADLVPALLGTGASVVDAIRADGTRWWRVLDPDPVAHDYDTQVHPFTAEQVFEGRAALGSRDELVGSLVGTDPRRRLSASPGQPTWPSTGCCPPSGRVRAAPVGGRPGGCTSGSPRRRQTASCCRPPTQAGSLP